MIRFALYLLSGLLLLSFPAVAGEWPHYGGDAGGTRHSAAAEITPSNIDDLQQAWLYSTGDMTAHADDMKHSAFEGTPVLAAGSLVFCSPFNEVIALDPGTGAQKWRYDPKIATGYRPGNQFVCRGVTPWTDETAASGDLCAMRLFMGTVDSRLIALDAATATVTVGPREALLTRRIRLREVNWLGQRPPQAHAGAEGELFVKVRSTRPPAPARIVAAQNGIISVVGMNGVMQSQLESAQRSQKDRQDFLAGMVSDIGDVDMAEAATRFQTAQNVLDVSARTFASLTQVSLLPFLR